jgi:hypothetical protein
MEKRPAQPTRSSPSIGSLQDAITAYLAKVVVSSARLSRAPNHLGRFCSAFTEALLAGRRVDFASGLGWLRDPWEPVTSGAFDFRRHFF